MGALTGDKSEHAPGQRADVFGHFHDSMERDDGAVFKGEANLDFVI
jgi:hypothetical protein